MGLSAQQRQDLRDRAAGLRADVGAAKLAATAAVDEASAAVDDAKLMREVERLEHERAEALATQARASVSATDAIKAMEDAAARLAGPAQPAPAPAPAPALPAAPPLTGLVDHLAEGDVVDASGEEN